MFEDIASDTSAPAAEPPVALLLLGTIALQHRPWRVLSGLHKTAPHPQA
jgi:hypothetical protein